MKIVKYLSVFAVAIGVLSSTVLADGFIVVPDRLLTPDPFPLEVKYHRVKVTIENKTALTEIDQEFYNPTERGLEGEYIFPLPDGAVIEKFSMFINGVETKAEMLDAVRARQTYEDIVRRMIDPALLEYSGQGLLKARIFPIEPHSTKRVKISYREILRTDGNIYNYTYPLNTEKFSPKPLKDVSVYVSVKNSKPVKNIFSPTHNIDVVRNSASSVAVSYEDMNVKPDTDFRLYYAVQPSPMGISILAHEGDGRDDGFFMMDIDPGSEYDGLKIADKDVTFVLDVSGSMRGENIEQAKKALKYCIRNLGKNDRFQVITYSTEADALFNALTLKTGSSVRKAINFIDALKAVGGTNMEDAFAKIDSNGKKDGRPHMIVFITDGKPTIGITEDEKLLNRISDAVGNDARIFTFGIGYEINTHLLDRITEMSGTFRSYISPKQDIDSEISRFFDKVSSPVMTDVNVSFTGGVRTLKIYPEKLPDLYKGSSISVLGRYRNASKGDVILAGKINGVRKEYRFNGGFDKPRKENSFIAPLWAMRRISVLLDKIRLHGEEKEIVDEITQLALQYGIITPYTSYLIMENEKQLVEENTVRREDRIFQLSDTEIERDNFDNAKKEYRNMFTPSGEQSVNSSTEIQRMNNASNTQEKDDIGLSSISGFGSKQMKLIDGRSFYFNGKTWIDSEIHKTKYTKTLRIKFGSTQYFSLLNSGVIGSRVASLGKNIRFISKGILYEIYE